MPQPFAVLKITDGTTTVDLLSASTQTGFCVSNWTPRITPLKAGGTWSNPPQAPGRELQQGVPANVIETFTVDVVGLNTDALIAETRNLRSLLEAARNYTRTTWSSTVVYMEMRSYCETESRYARIKDYLTPTDGDPYQAPFWNTAGVVSMEDFQLTIEREPYTSSNVPGVGTPTELSAVEAYDGRNLGNVDDVEVRDPTTANEVYIANKRNVANLTDVYVDDGGVWGANRMNAALPFAMFPVVPVANDAIYFGIDTTVADSGPFNNLVFNIGTAGAGYTAAWEIWTGAWVALTTDDHTDTAEPLDTLGVNSVNWEQPSGWVVRNIAADGGPAITGYWVRLRVTGVPGALTAPTQQSRDIYSCIWDYVEIQSEDVGGDVPALARIQNYIMGFISGAGPGSFERLIMGLRSTSRGDDFTAIINCADEQNPAGITVAVAAMAFIDDVETATGRCVNRVFAAPAIASFTITFGQAITQSYKGSFHVYVRAQFIGANPTDCSVQIAQSFGGGAFQTTERVFFKAASTAILDFGIMNVVPIFGHPVGDVILSVAFTTTTVGEVRAYDVILLPIDEWAADISMGDSVADGARMLPDEFIDLDPITYPKKVLPYKRDDSVAGDPVLFNCLLIENGTPMIQANSQQRLWFFAMQYDSTTNDYFTEGVTGISRIQIERNQRYWSMRGAG